MEAELLDLARLDRDVARAAASLAKWRAAAAVKPEAAPEDPLEAARHVAGKRTYEALGELDVPAHHAELRDGLRRWVAWLTEARIVLGAELEVARAAAEAVTPLATEPGRRVSWNEARRGVVCGARGDVRAAWLDAVVARAPAIAPLARDLAERRDEVRARLGFDAAAAYPTATPRAELERAAHVLLDATDDLWRSLLGEARRAEDASALRPATVAFDVAMARDAREGWPARLTSRWLDERVGRFARGVTIPALAVPEAIGATSYARALGAFGGALRRAAPRSLPFALASDPAFVDAHRFELLFASLAANRAFHRRALGVATAVADTQARLLGRAAVYDARLHAARLLVLARPGADFCDELSVRLFDEPLRVRGAWPAARADEPARAVALFTSLPLVRDVVSRFDVDWFDNPRAVEFLRARAGGAAHEAAAKDLEGAARGLAHALERLATGSADVGGLA